MSRFRYHEDDSSSAGTIVGVLVGAIAGFAAGMFVAQRVGGLSGLRAKLRRPKLTDDDARLGAAHGVADEDEEFDDIGEDELEADSEVDDVLEERVLEAFRNDPILAERAIDIGGVSEGVIELAGWVNEESEAQHAVTIARGVPDVSTVINRIAVGEEERRLADAAERFDDGDPSLTEGRWEGQRVGTGRRRQGNSAEPDRHADPKVDLQERWLRDEASRELEPDVGDKRRPGGRKASRGDRSGGMHAPGGVPRADHVVPRDTGPDRVEPI